jgi:hypothetical protein
MVEAQNKEKAMSITITRSQETGQYIATINYPAGSGMVPVACIATTIADAVSDAARRIGIRERVTTVLA